MYFVKCSQWSDAMSQITDYFTQAELALAAYANLLPNVDPVPALTDDAVGMSATQATTKELKEELKGSASILF